ncbi:hypothetical protein AOLI_G00067640 [Acnodon oligacanthus]
MCLQMCDRVISVITTLPETHSRPEDSAVPTHSPSVYRTFDRSSLFTPSSAFASLRQGISTNHQSRPAVERLSRPARIPTHRRGDEAQTAHTFTVGLKALTHGRIPRKPAHRRGSHHRSAVLVPFQMELCGVIS